MLRLLGAAALAFACGSDEPRPNATDHASGSAAPAVPVTPALMPDVPGAKLLAQANKSDAHATASWCIDEQDAIDRIMIALARAGWTDVRMRGTVERPALAASRGDLRFSAAAGGSHDRCAGTFVTATVMRIGAAK